MKRHILKELGRFFLTNYLELPNWCKQTFICLQANIAYEVGLSTIYLLAF